MKTSVLIDRRCAEVVYGLIHLEMKTESQTSIILSYPNNMRQRVLREALSLENLLSTMVAGMRLHGLSPKGFRFDNALYLDSELPS